MIESAYTCYSLRLLLILEVPDFCILIIICIDIIWCSRDEDVCGFLSSWSGHWSSFLLKKSDSVLLFDAIGMTIMLSISCFMPHFHVGRHPSFSRGSLLGIYMYCTCIYMYTGHRNFINDYEIVKCFAFATHLSITVSPEEACLGYTCCVYMYTI